MIKIYNTISDPEYYKEISSWYENGSLNQWLLYTKSGCDSYYDGKDQFYDKKDAFVEEDFLDFWKKQCFEKQKKTLLISIWCWNSQIEKSILSSLWDEYNIDYLWIDSSEDMLKLSIQNLKNIKNNVHFIRADFSSENLLKEINKISSEYEKRIFAFFWWTFWNIKHTKISNILSNLLSTWEQIWIDIYTRKWKNIEDDLKLHDIYKNYLTDKKEIDFLCDRLREDGIDIKNWELILESKNIHEIWAIIFTFIFKFKVRTEINIRFEQITFLPESRIELLKIYRFEPEGFIDFFSEYHFKLIDKQIKWYRGQFLFEKN